LFTDAPDFHSTVRRYFSTIGNIKNLIAHNAGVVCLHVIPPARNCKEDVMKRAIVAVGILVLAFSVTALAESDAYFSKADIDQIIVREFGSYYEVIVLLKSPVNGFDGFYFTDYANLQEALAFGDMFRRGRIKGVRHYDEGSGHTAWWGSNKISVIHSYYLK